MIQRRTRGTGIKTRVGNHTFRATGITPYLKIPEEQGYAGNRAAHRQPREPADDQALRPATG